MNYIHRWPVLGGRAKSPCRLCWSQRRTATLSLQGASIS